MANRSRLQIAKADIVACFDRQDSRVFRSKDVGRILAQERAGWRLAANTTGVGLTNFLIEHSQLQRHTFDFPNRAEILYVWRDAPTMEMLLHLKSRSYYSHYTAMRMHGLTEQIPTSIYISHERTVAQRHELGGVIGQESIDAAFGQPARVTQNTALFGDRRIVLIHGGGTKLLGVVEQAAAFGTQAPANIRVTNLERTLIEAAAKPWYSGGVAEVAKAYEAARQKVSVNRLCATLSRLGYAYPYHQAIGFYMERAGYRTSQLDLVRRLPVCRDFYLEHAMSNPRYVKDWRIYVPSGF